MPVVTFAHPDIDGGSPFAIETGADQIEWGFGLNHVTYPTYGGEVVQILSTYIDDLSISGTSRTYREIERIYGWFLNYVQIASQGHGGPGDLRYIETPVTFNYPERGWALKVKPVGLPGYRLATTVVAPTWQIKCRVVEDDPKMRTLTLDAATKGLADFGKMDASFGSTSPESNPFSNPFPDKTQVDSQATSEAFSQIGDYFTNLIPAYAQGDFSTLFGSGPTPFLNTDRTGPAQTTTVSP